MRKPRISDTEWAVMKTLWANSPQSAKEVIDQIAAKRRWHPKTVKTLLNRLVNKKALGFKKNGRAYLYRPLLKESDAITAASESFLQRVFDGSLKPMVAHFLQHRKLSRKQAVELKELLNGKGE